MHYNYGFWIVYRELLNTIFYSYFENGIIYNIFENENI